jgi:hypothetical protein
MRPLLSLGLGVISAFALVAAFMALQDIYHQEADLALEWQIVRISMFVIAGFHAVALPALWKVAKTFSAESEND